VKTQTKRVKKAQQKKTIAEFRRENIRPLQKLFMAFVKLCRSWEIIGGGSKSEQVGGRFFAL